MKTSGGRVLFTMEAAATFGLEAVVRDELLGLGVSVTSTLDRRVVFQGTALDMARCNVRLRTADRVWLRMADFPAADFDELFEGVRKAAWRDLLPRTAAVLVKARSARSRLSAVPAIQSVSKKAIVDALLGVRGHHVHQRAEESGPEYTVEVSILHDHATVCLDTSGAGLHKRGYRTEAGAAPLRENLAAALVLLSRWDPSRPLADPLCGSGTIAIEAAMIARGAAPGRSAWKPLARSFFCSRALSATSLQDHDREVAGAPTMNLPSPEQGTSRSTLSKEAGISSPTFSPRPVLTSTFLHPCRATL